MFFFFLILLFFFFRSVLLNICYIDSTLMMSHDYPLATAGCLAKGFNELRSDTQPDKVASRLFKVLVTISSCIF